MDIVTIAQEQFLDEYAGKLKVLGHPVRLKLLCLIARQADPCVSELWVCLNQPQPVVSQHLAVLKEKGIVRSEVQGNRRIYSIVDPFVRRLIETMDCQTDD
jgi:ArsR family transcriptional regulator, arsenate/arsenite/antimonite-responsive transcriptional repressor